jgi:hypothetical protein
MLYTIGWSHKNHIIINNADVYSEHCSLEIISPSIMIIKNLNKYSKTYINRTEIQVGELNPGDQLTLGNCDIEYFWLKERIMELEQNMNYKDELLQLRKLHENYQKTLNQIIRKYQKEDLLLRIIFSLIPVIGSILLRKFLGINAYVLGSLSSTFVVAVNFFRNYNIKAKEEINALKVEFLLKYKCPKCKVRFGELDWRLIQDQIKCNSCKICLKID